MIPALEQIIKRGGALGLRDIVIGMPHRGRLNVLASVMGKPFRAIFNEFKGGSATPDEVEGSGDVKYHLGTSSDREFDGNTVHLSLTANPSHLEVVDPVVLGKVRAKQDQHGDEERISALPLLLHGDAAFAGQGVVAECLGLSGLKGHKSGGSIHFIVNNQIGFTTSPIHSRSSPYPSDVAKMIEAPIFHVNGDDPEAVVYAAKVAIEFRQEFRKPVVIDMFCYRRYGHNESDEPFFTQPIMYKRIKEHPTVVKVYSDRLVREGVMTQAEVEKMKADFRQNLEQEFDTADSYKPNKADWLDGKWSGLTRPDDESARRGRTGVDLKRLQRNRPQDHRDPGRLQRSPHAQARDRQPPQDDRGGPGDRLGDGRASGVRDDPRGGLSGAPVGPGLRARHVLAAPFGAERPGRRIPLHPAQQHLRNSGPLTRSSTRCCRRRRCSASNTATASPSPMRWSSGKRSSAISPTARRW